MENAGLVAAILFGATLVSATFGFGSALFAMPLLTVVIGLKLATPLCGLVGPTISLMILLGEWRKAEYGSVLPLIVMTGIGIPLGTWALQHLPEVWMLAAIGTVLVGYGGYQLRGFYLPAIASPRWSLVFGLVAGILGGAYNTNGPPIVLYGNLRRWTPDQFRASLQGYFFPTGLLIGASHGASGLWTPEVFRLYGAALPGVIGAIAIGSWLSRRLSAQSFQKGLSALLMLLGVLLWRSAWQQIAEHTGG